MLANLKGRVTLYDELQVKKNVFDTVFTRPSGFLVNKGVYSLTCNETDALKDLTYIRSQFLGCSAWGSI